MLSSNVTEEVMEEVKNWQSRPLDGLYPIVYSPCSFPGLLIGLVAARLFGITAGGLACGVSNGAAYGFRLYGWYRGIPNLHLSALDADG